MADGHTPFAGKTGNDGKPTDKVVGFALATALLEKVKDGAKNISDSTIIKEHIDPLYTRALKFSADIVNADESTQANFNDENADVVKFNNDLKKALQESFTKSQGFASLAKDLPTLQDVDKNSIKYLSLNSFAEYASGQKTKGADAVKEYMQMDMVKDYVSLARDSKKIPAGAEILPLPMTFDKTSLHRILKAGDFAKLDPYSQKLALSMFPLHNLNFAESGKANSVAGTTAQPLATTAGATYQPEFLADLYQDALRPLGDIISALGITTRMMGRQGGIPKKSSYGSAQWLAEGVAATETNFQMSSITLTGNRLVSVNSFTLELERNYDQIGVQRIILQDLLDNIQQALIQAVISGSGSGQPLGLFNLGVADAGLLNPPQWSDFTKLIADVFRTNAFSQSGGKFSFLTTPEVLGRLKATGKSTIAGGSTGFFSDFIVERSAIPTDEMSGMLDGYKIFAHNLVPTNLGAAPSNKHGLMFGDFSRYVLAQFGGLYMITDNITGAGAGATKMYLTKLYDGNSRLNTSFKTANYNPA